MAKGNLILGTARGKLGDTVMYRKDGQQLSRVRVRKISNPKTEPQAMQRALLGTLGTAYSYMKGIADHSFQTAQGSLANMKVFMKQNQGKARATGSLDYPSSNAGYNFNPKGEPYLRPNSYVISRGTMPNLPLKELHTGDLSNGFTLDDRFQDLLNTDTTYAAFCTRLGVEVGTQLTFCIINDDTFVGPPTAENKPLPYGNFHYCRVILSDDSGNGDVPMFESSSGDLIINSKYANSKNQGSLVIKRLGESTLALVVQGFQYAIAAACITSNYSSGRWLRSNTDFEVSTNVQNSSTMLDVVESYMQSESAPQSTQYLNQGDGTKSSDSVPASVLGVLANDGDLDFLPNNGSYELTVPAGGGHTFVIATNQNFDRVTVNGSPVMHIDGAYYRNTQKAMDYLLSQTDAGYLTEASKDQVRALVGSIAPPFNFFAYNPLANADVMLVKLADGTEFKITGHA